MKLALGSAQFGLDYGIANREGQISIKDARAILQYASDQGVATIDTAIGYGDSELRLGEAGVKGWQVVTKLPEVPAAETEIDDWVVSSVAGSLQRLQLSSLHGLLLHRPDALLRPDGEQLYASLQRLKQDGLVRKVGISIYDPSELDAICERYPLDLVQAPFNIVDRRLADSGWLRRLHDAGTEIHVRSIFLQGLLLMAPQQRPEKFAHWSPLWQRFEGWLNQNEVSALQACLGFAASFAEIDRILVGVDSLRQLQSIVAALRAPVPSVPDDLASDDLSLVEPSRWAALV